MLRSTGELAKLAGSDPRTLDGSCMVTHMACNQKRVHPGLAALLPRTAGSHHTAAMQHPPIVSRGGSSVGAGGLKPPSPRNPMESRGKKEGEGEKKEVGRRKGG